MAIPGGGGGGRGEVEKKIGNVIEEHGVRTSGERV